MTSAAMPLSAPASAGSAASADKERNNEMESRLAAVL